MYSLEDALKQCNKESIIDGVLEYEDSIPYSTEEIDKNNHNHYVMKYYEGTISPEEHNEFNDDISIRKVYNKYIFNADSVLGEEFEIDDNDIDDLIYLKIIISKESGYLERLDKLMIRIYFEKKKIQLEGLMRSIYEKYDWAKQYIQNQKENELSLFFQESTDEYNKNFRIIENSSDEKRTETKPEENSTESNWILQKFGG